MKRTVEVVAAVIVEKDLILCTQRPKGKSFSGFWEFPGGKVEKGETLEEALIREIKEELDATIKLDSLITLVNYEYSDFFLKMHVFRCSLLDEKVTPLENQKTKWLKSEDLYKVKWLPSDGGLIKLISEEIK